MICTIRTTITALTLAASLAACATSPDRIKPAYVSSAPFDVMSCPELLGRQMELQHERDELANRIERRRRSDSIMVGVGVAVAWPALLFIKGNGDVKAQYARVSGEYQAASTAVAAQGCVG